MRVLHFFKTYIPDTIGGIEQVINQIARGSIQAGVTAEVLTLTSGAPGTLEVDGHRVHRVRRDLDVASTGFALGAFRRYRELARAADLIHYHFPWPFMDMVHFAAPVNKPSVVSYHSDIVRQARLLKLYAPLMHRFLDSVDHIVAASPNYLATSEVLARYRHKTSVIPYGLDRASYPAATPERLAYWRSCLGGRFFLFVGMLRYYKGLHILLDALRGTDYPVVIVGAGPVEAELRQHAVRLGLAHVHFLGALPDADKVALLTLCYGVVFPSHLRAEAFGISLLEGAMYGKPMISSEIGTGTSYINIDGETGLVVPPSDPAALRAAMRALWQQPERAAAMGARAEARYRELFSADIMVQRYLERYQTVCAARAEDGRA